MKKVTAVLPARNCRQQLFRCLSALVRGSYVPDIIVVDDGSDDQTLQMVRKHWPAATCLSLPAHTGYAHAANAGLRLVRTEFAFLIRPDLQAGKNCVARLLEAMDPEAMESEVFCAVPQFRTAGEETRPRAGKRAEDGKQEAGNKGGELLFPEKPRRKVKGRPAAQIIAVPDGCAMYRMRALEETGWLDERHFDGLEAFDLSLRAALDGWKTVRVCGAAVRRTATEGKGKASGGSGTFRRQVAAGNAMYVFYKNIPGPVRLLGLPLYAAADAAMIASSLRRGEFGAYRTGIERGRTLCGLEKERRAALDSGISVWPENLSDASFLGMEEAAEKIYPLYLAEKEPASAGRAVRCLRLQGMMAAELPQLIRLMQ